MMVLTPESKSQEACPECKGKRRIAIPSLVTGFEEATKICPTCQGTGKAQSKPDSLELRDAIEKVFASVAKLEPKAHKNVLGDKWKYIDAVVEYVDLIDTEAIKREELRRVTEVIENISSIGHPYGGDYKAAILQALGE